MLSGYLGTAINLTEGQRSRLQASAPKSDLLTGGKLRVAMVRVHRMTSRGQELSWRRRGNLWRHDSRVALLNNNLARPELRRNWFGLPF